jgi:hypothetical protein
MSDVFRVRLTGVIRDYTASGGGDLDPYCECEAAPLDQVFADDVSSIACRVVTSAGIPVPWYAAGIYFFNTLGFTAAGGGLGGGRVYTLQEADDNFDPVVLAVRSVRTDGTTSVCIEIPHDHVFNGVVMGLSDPSENAKDPDTAHDDTNSGPGIVFPGDFAWLMLVAPDGTTYGATKDGSDRRIPVGHYTGSINAGTPVDGGDVNKEAGVMFAKQGLQPYTPVLITNFTPETFLFQLIGSDYLGAWEITPTDRPDAQIEKVYDDGGSVVTANFQPGRICTVDPLTGNWDVAVVKDSTPGNNNVRSPLQRFGVALWNNSLAGGDGIAAVVSWGRFWLSPSAVPLEDNTVYYLDPEASLTLGTLGDFTPNQPSNSPCHRPIFRHTTLGWCVMIESEPSIHMAWAYQGIPQGSGSGEDRLAEVVFDSFPDTDNAEGVLRYRDRSRDESADLASGEAEDEQAESNDVMAWFVGDAGVHRAMVIKRLDLIIDSGTADVTGGIQGGAGGWENNDDRPGVLSFFYRAGTRIKDEWDLAGGGIFDDNSNHMARIWPKAGVQGDSDRGGVIELSDSGKTVAEWFVHPSVGSGGSATPGLTDPDDRKRKWAWYMSVEHWGWDLEWKLHSTNDITQPASDTDWTTGLILQQEDAYSIYANSSPVQAVLAASRAAAFPLKFRELTICDDTDTVRKICVICSDMYD